MEAHSRKKSVIKRDHVRLDGHEAGPELAAAAAPQPAPCAARARVRLLRLDEHAQAIEFTCACGEVSLIELKSEQKP